MQVGFFFWPDSPDLVRRMSAAAERYGYDMIGIADTPGNAMDPWVAATMVARATERPRIALRRRPPRQSPRSISWHRDARSSASVRATAEPTIWGSAIRGSRTCRPALHTSAHCCAASRPHGGTLRRICHG
jgi:hypothetical protein